jgi:hypothetical protein
MDDTGREPINDKTCCGEGITPKAKRKRGMSKKGQARLNNVAMFALGCTILLVCVRARYPMRDANVAKETIKFDILASPVRLHMNNFLIKKTLNMVLELQENIKDITLAFKKI